MESEERVYNTVARVFSIEREKVDINSSNETIESWDSLGQLQLIMALESEFNTRFKTNEIPKLTSVRKLIEKIKTLHDTQS